MTDIPAVLALHYQNDVLHSEGRIRLGLAYEAQRKSLLEAAAVLLEGARHRHWSIIHVRIAFRDDYADCPRNMPIMRRAAEINAVRDGHWGSEFMAGLEPHDSPSEFVVTHTRVSAFAGTSLSHLLRDRGTRRLLVGGVATHSVVEGTVRDAADQGFDVWVAADACAAADPLAHDAALASMAHVGTLSSVREAMDRLEHGA
jgi:nicotinamidase-related amidase